MCFRTRKGASLLLLLGVLLFSLSGCKGGLFGKVLPEGLLLDRTHVEFTSFSQSCQLSVQVQPEKASATDILWQSSDPSVAAVDENGLVTPVGNGEALVSAVADSGIGAANCRVVVSAVSSVGLNVHSAALELGQSLQLICVTEPESGTGALLHWSSSNPAIVSVDSGGLVTAISVGEADITVSSQDGTLTDTCRVIVTRDVPLEKLELDRKTFQFTFISDILTLTPVFTPADTSQRGVVWSSSDPSVVTVDRETGEVMPVGNGKAIVTVQSTVTDLSATCEVTVDMNIPLEGLTVLRDSYTFRDFGQTYLITPVFEPAGASNKKISYSSSDPSVASVSEGGIVTSHKNGETTITLKAEDGGFTTVFRVVVNRPDDPVVRVSGLTLDVYSCQLSAVGQTAKITPTILPANAADKTVTYLSRNQAVAVVANDGTVTAVGFGKAEIVVTTNDGGFSEIFLLTVSPPVEPEPEPEPEEEELRGVWVATVHNIDFPSRQNLTAAELKAEIDELMNQVLDMGLNAVFLQVRPASDALYSSSIFPSSAYVVGTQGKELPLDVLEYAVEAAHKRGIQLHAWLNPYRVTTSGTNLTELAESNPARLHPEWVVSNGSALYYNPGLPEVRQLILDGVMEIVRNYDVDGIHFDDYFYPYENISAFDDSEAYAKYGSGMTLADWRRSNNDKLIESVYRAIQEYKSSVLFGVSPAAVWQLASVHPDGVPVKSAAQTYSKVFADTRKWVLNGWLDYICPQIYFEFEHSTAPFKPIADWWNELVSQTDVRLYIGIAAYKGASVPAFSSPTQIEGQLDYLQTLKSVDGVIFYNYSSLQGNVAGIRDLLISRYYREPQEIEGASDRLIFSAESMTVDASYTHAYVLGVSDPNYPLYVNGQEVERSYQGYFAYYATLVSSGTTTLTFEHKGKVYSYEIYKRKTTSGDGDTLNVFGFIPGSFSPTYDFGAKSGTELKFSCKAPEGATVYVMLGSLRVELAPVGKVTGNGNYKVQTYEGVLTLPQVDDDLNRVLGYAIFYAEKGEEAAQYSPGCMVEIINQFSTSSGELIRDKVDILPNLEVDPDLYYIGTLGTKVCIVSKADGYAKLSNGMYVSVAYLRRVEEEVPKATVRQTGISSSGKYTTLSVQMDAAILHTVWMGEDAAEITLYHLKSTAVPVPSVGANPLFSSASVETVDQETVKIVLNYRKSLHIYGYYANFDGTTLYVNFRNPVTLRSGDRFLEGIVISLDPGHSTSSGAVGSFGNKTLEEADVAMDLALRVEERLKALGATVVLTHRGEQKKELDQLITEYRKLSPDINVSIHFNAVGESGNPNSAKGTETWWCYNNSHLLADIMLSEFTECTGLRKRASKCGYYKVSRLCEFPSILFETAFITNPDDFEWFLSDENRDTAADGIVRGIVAFFREQNA